VDDPIEWVRAAQAGDRDAFDRLIGAHGRPLLRYLLNLTGSAASADDLAQEAWIQAWRAVHNLDDPALFYGWLIKIAYRQWLRALRKRPPAIVTLQEESAQSARAPQNKGAQSHEENAELNEAVRRAIQRLPEDQRAVVAMRFGEGLSHAQIAEITGDEVPTVRWRLFMGRQALQSMLKDWQPVRPVRQAQGGPVQNRAKGSDQ